MSAAGYSFALPFETGAACAGAALQIGQSSSDRPYILSAASFPAAVPSMLIILPSVLQPRKARCGTLQILYQADRIFFNRPIEICRAREHLFMNKRLLRSFNNGTHPISKCPISTLPFCAIPYVVVTRTRPDE